MVRWLTIVLTAAAASLAVALVSQGFELRQARRDLHQLRARLDRAEARQREAPSRAVVDRMQDQIAAVERKAEARPVPAPVRPEAPPTSVTEEDIQKIVDERVEQKLQARSEERGRNGDDRKLPLHDIAKDLALDPAAQARIAQIANAAKKEIFEILRTPRPGQASLADEIIDSVLSGDQARVQQTFLKAFTEKLPGSDQTYLAFVARIQQEAYADLERAMPREAYLRYRHMNVKPENIETGYDPLGEYWLQRGGP